LSPSELYSHCLPGYKWVTEKEILTKTLYRGQGEEEAADRVEIPGISQDKPGLMETFPYHFY